ncbi:MAG TPA: tetratricopeptide repeat protein [Gemmataceae bacterium]|jgi:hypothetical protein
MNQYGRAALVLLAIPISADAQVGPFAIHGDFAGARHHRPVSGVRRVVIFPTIGGGPFFGPPFVPLSGGNVLPWGGYPPPLLWGSYPAFGFGGAGPAIMPRIVIDAQPLGPEAGPPPAANPPRGRGAGLQGERASRFRPVGQADREQAGRPVRAEPAPPPAALPPDPKAEHVTLILNGRRAFAAGEYGRSAELFLRATAAHPESADADFLLAQAQLALGKYPEAVAAAFRGMSRQPDWPATGPALRDLYGGQAERLSEHRRRLDEAVAADPADPALAFLRAYVVWFVGDRDSARALFRALRDRVSRPDVIDRFLAS